VTTPVLAGLADAMERAATDPDVKVVRLGGAPHPQLDRPLNGGER
jgi:enoyl-CoA hydratase/carnithine racemase